MKKLIAAAAAVLAVGSFTAGTANASTLSIYDTAVAVNAPGGPAEGLFTTLIAAVDAAGLGEGGPLDDCDYGPVTVFAPLDSAFDKLPEGTVDELLGDTDELTNVLLYHVLAGEFLSTDVLALPSPSEVEMANESMATITHTSAPTIKINESNVVLALGAGGSYDVPACNGVIHVIDTVLIPPADGDMGGDTGSGTTMAMLAAALLGAGLVVTTISRRRVTA